MQTPTVTLCPLKQNHIVLGRKAKLPALFGALRLSGIGASTNHNDKGKGKIVPVLYF
jgi:hypothetical protein